MLKFRIAVYAIAAALTVAVLTVSVTAARPGGSGQFDLVETSIPKIQQAIQDGVITGEQLVQMYLNRIAAYDGKSTTTHLNS